MKNCNYNKAKLIYKLSKLSYFIEQFGKKDADNNGCKKLMQEVQKEIDEQIHKLKEALCEQCSECK